MIKKPYFLSFVEEAVMNPKYKDYVAGRIEVFKDPIPYDIEEIRFFTKNLDEYYEFREKWDLSLEVSEAELNEIKKIVAEKFYDEVD